MDIKYMIEDFFIGLKDNIWVFGLVAIALIPTAIYHIMTNNGAIVPFAIESLAIRNTWGIIAVVVGIFIGTMINNSKIGK